MFQPTRARRYAHSVLTAVLCLVPAGVAHAFTWEPTPTLFALMPEHCKARLADHQRNRRGEWKHRFPINEPRIREYRQLIGHDFIHMHHYCAGLGHLMLANTSRARSQWNFKRAEAEIDYTIGRSNPSEPLWVEMNIAQARARSGLGKHSEAIRQLERLLTLQPDNETIYVELAQVKRRAGNINDAIAILEEGLAKGAKEGPIMFYLARYHWDLGDTERARELTERAEAAGMKMDSLRAKLGSD